MNLARIICMGFDAKAYCEQHMETILPGERLLFSFSPPVHELTIGHTDYLFRYNLNTGYLALHRYLHLEDLPEGYSLPYRANTPVVRAEYPFDVLGLPLHHMMTDGPMYSIDDLMGVRIPEEDIPLFIQSVYNYDRHLFDG